MPYAIQQGEPGAGQDQLARIWDKHRDTILERVGMLERAVGALVRSRLSEQLRAEAQRSAHQLAGTLGTFGFTTGSENAREMELIFESAQTLGPSRVPILAELVTGLRREVEVARAEPKPQGPRSPSLRGWVDAPRLLIVDDDQDLTDRLAAEAGRRGMQVDVGLTPAAARELALRRRPDAVLLDLTFPGGTAEAYELLSELASSSPAVPVLVLTVRDAFTDRMEVARRGATGFLHKSLAPEDALDHVAQILERPRTAGTRVLVVDDDPVILDAVQVLLEAEGLAVTTLDDPLRFWDELERVNPTLLLLDVEMPGASGIELCQTLRNAPRWAAVPVLFLTSRRDAPTVQSIFAAGADDYLTKPIIGAELVTRINNRLDRFLLHQALAETDSLTGVANRRSARESLDQLIRLADRFGQPLCLAEIDLDHFKTVNDCYGHPAGDAVLRRLGDQLLRTFRGEDVTARWGGEEFLIAMYGMARQDGVHRIAQLLEAFREEEFRAGGERFSCTFSGGVAQFPDDGANLDRLYQAADQALYRAKSVGRDRVLAAGGARDGAADRVDVVVVEDDEVVGELLRHTLETRGFRTRWYTDGAQATVALCGSGRRVGAGVVLLDVDLPELDGLDVLRRLRDAGVLQDTRVVMLTGRSSEQETRDALALGAFDHIAKPFTVPVLMHKVRSALER
ncbi:MAG TPA: response regulator [Baekduia sp.]|nr:response regulator [Baekduia sp.]